MKKRLIIFLSIFIVILTIASTALGLIFIPKYLATRSLASYVADYRKEAEEFNNKKVDCDFQRKRDDLVNNPASNLTSTISSMNDIRASYDDESFCYKKSSPFLSLENNIIQLDNIDCKTTDYYSDCEELLTSLKKQKDIWYEKDSYAEKFYSAQVYFFSCKIRVLQVTFSNSDSYLDGKNATTFKEGLDLCVKDLNKITDELSLKYTLNDSMFEDLEKLQNKSREITKKLNEILN